MLLGGYFLWLYRSENRICWDINSLYHSDTVFFNGNGRSWSPMTNDDLPFGHQTWLENPIMEVFMGTSYIRVNLITTEACSPETWNQGECIGKSSP